MELETGYTSWQVDIRIYNDYTQHMFSINDTQSKCDTQLEAISAKVAFERAPLACAPHVPGVDILRGCRVGCLFCPYKWRGVNAGSCQLKVDILDVLESEVSTRKRNGNLAEHVLFNHFSDSFPQNPSARSLAYEVLKVLLENGIKISMKTRGVMPDGFKDLFKEYSSSISVEVDFFTMDEQLAKLYEPCAAHPQLRLDTIRTLLSLGVEVKAGMGPLIPFINDTTGHMEELVRHVRSAGATKAVSYYLYLAKGMLESFEENLPVAHFRLIKGAFRRRPWQQVGIYQMYKFLPVKVRTEGYERLGKIAKASDLLLTVCKCKDPSLGVSCVDKVPDKVHGGDESGQLSLFSVA